MDEIQPIYSGSGPLKIVGALSGSGSSINAVLNDPDYGTLFEFVGAYTDNPRTATKGLALLHKHGIPVVEVDFDEFYGKHRDLSPKKLEDRAPYCDAILKGIGAFSPDIVLNSGFMKIYRGEIVKRFMGKNLNVHPARLSIVKVRKEDENRLRKKDGYLLSAEDILTEDELKALQKMNPGSEIDDGHIFIRENRLEIGDLSTKAAVEFALRNGLKRKYVGGEAVKLTIGEPFTQSTIHFLTDEVDHGAIVVASRRKYGIEREHPELAGVTEAIDELQKLASGLGALSIKELNGLRILGSARAGITKQMDTLIKAYVTILQEEMKTDCDGPAYLEALRLIAKGQLAFAEGVVYVKKNGVFQPLPYGGLELTE